MTSGAFLKDKVISYGPTGQTGGAQESAKPRAWGSEQRRACEKLRYSPLPFSPLHPSLLRRLWGAFRPLLKPRRARDEGGRGQGENGFSKRDLRSQGLGSSLPTYEASPPFQNRGTFFGPRSRTGEPFSVVLAASVGLENGPSRRKDPVCPESGAPIRQTGRF